MTGEFTYVPILRWKRAERIALRELFSKDKRIIIPLIEIIPRDFSDFFEGEKKALNGIISIKSDEIYKNWGSTPFYIDFIHLPSKMFSTNGIHAFEILLRKLLANNLYPIPVTGISRDKELNKVIIKLSKSLLGGVCIRVSRSELLSSNFNLKLSNLIRDLNIKEQLVDLMIDFQYVDGKILNFKKIFTKLTSFEKWRRLIFSSGAFPKDLTQFKVGQHLLSRSDWKAWNKYVNNESLPRIPIFSDYTIQHPHYSEPPTRMNFSASIRYTSKEDWVIMRGEGVFHVGSPGYKQWPANAYLLTERSEFCGSKFCYGDNYISAMGHQIQKTGNPETWLRASINHHITYVIHQLSKIS